jgi:hypothetical protein
LEAALSLLEVSGPEIEASIEALHIINKQQDTGGN